MSKIKLNYKVSFTVNGEDRIRTKQIEATSKNDAKRSLIILGYDVNEIVTFKEI